MRVDELRFYSRDLQANFQTVKGNKKAQPVNLRRDG
jgi:hypothetical protein